MIRRSVKATMILATGVFLLVSGSASASHELQVAHVPPPTAVAGQDVALTVEFAGDCAPFCSEIDITLRYLDADGRMHAIAQQTPAHVPAGTAAFVIPGRHVGPAWTGYLTYSFEATQVQCAFAHDCHTVRATSPFQGTYRVPIILGTPAALQTLTDDD